MAQWKAPNYLQRIGAVIDFWQNPCGASWIVYAELSVVPAGKAILQLVVPTPLDVVRAYLRPKRLRREGRKGRRRPDRKRRAGIPDTSEVIGKRLPGYRTLANRSVAQGAKRLWLVDGAIQRVFWYWLIAEVTLDFFYEWTTAIAASEECKLQYGGQGVIGADDFLIGSGNWFLPGNRYEIEETGVVGVPANQAFMGFPGGSVSLFIRNNGGGFVRIRQLTWFYTQQTPNIGRAIVALKGVTPEIDGTTISLVCEFRFSNGKVFTTDAYDGVAEDPDDGLVFTTNEVRV